MCVGSHYLSVYFILVEQRLIKHFEMFIGALYLPAFVRQRQAIS